MAEGNTIEPRPIDPRSVWRDPILLIPIITIAIAGAVLIATWQRFSPPAPNTAASPTLTLRPNDPTALALLQGMEAAMNDLKTLKAIQLLRDDSGHSLTTTMMYAAPNVVYLQTSTQAESLVIGEQQWIRDPGQTLWETLDRTQPFEFPNFGDYAGQAHEVAHSPETTFGGQPVQTITFTVLTYTGSLAYKIYGDSETHLFRRLTMDGPDHHMIIDFVDYAPTVTLTPPPVNLIAPTTTP